MDEEETQLLRNSLTYIEILLTRYEPRRETAWRVQPGSSLAGDDARTDPYHLSHSVQHALQVAIDHVQCLRSSLVERMDADKASVVLHTHGQATLLRGALENSARAVWLIAPPQRLERVRRRLTLQADDHKNNRAMAAVVAAAMAPPCQPRADPDTLFPRSEAEQWTQLVALFQAAGATLTEPKALKSALKFTGYADIVRTAGQELARPPDFDGSLDMGKVLEFAWKGCSALAHGDLSGSLNQLPRQVQSQTGKILFVRMTGSVTNLHFWTTLACMTITKALDLFDSRARKYH
ncbi:hypothetical protein ABUW04_07115 [Streptacidiphilus sp. N1-10]|uniref:Uncharacterized protein n=1 Tax=Streptacidiphilus jeojiensis TaxID=3229225 RepID=A0ABV6XIC4_9ACTN